MHMTAPAYLNTDSDSITPGAGAEGTASQQTAASSNFARGAVVMATFRQTAGVADTIVYRFYDGAAATGNLLRQVSVVFTAVPESATWSPELPIPFFSGLFVTAEATDAARISTVFPKVQLIAGPQQ